jgi:riboflavin synthase
MFTGIIEGSGTITRIRRSGQGLRLGVETDLLFDQTKIGDSIAVSGACLTAVTITGTWFEVDVSPETLGITTLGKAKIGDRVNIERALRFSDRIDGHLVSGHIDGTGIFSHQKTAGNAIIMKFDLPKPLLRYMIVKGSVAVDGISLTINRCDEHGFEVSIIPHTAKITTLGFKKIGDRVNIETDMIGKYVERFVTRRNENNDQKQTDSPVDMQLLARNGFL